jgi:hypothetical protein
MNGGTMNGNAMNNSAVSGGTGGSAGAFGLPVSSGGRSRARRTPQAPGPTAD